MGDRRKTIQEEVRNDFGELEKTIIYSYEKNKNFISGKEYFLYKALKEIYKDNNDIEIFVQVALNKIILINNNRLIKEMNFFKFNERSIDFVIYNSNKKDYGILYCIELNGLEHYNDAERIERDRILKNIFNIARLELKILNQKDIEVDENGFYKIESIKKLLNL